MRAIRTEIREVLIIEPKIFTDERGYFFESYNEDDFSEDVMYLLFRQENESYSRYGVVRGLHYQKDPSCQYKLVRCVKGAILDVAVDIRKGSPTFGQHVAVELTEENHRQLFVPRGFAHGFSVLSPDAIVIYKCQLTYSPKDERAIAWDDPDLGIDWKIPAADVILSEKDKHNPRLKDAEWLFDYDTERREARADWELTRERDRMRRMPPPPFKIVETEDNETDL